MSTRPHYAYPAPTRLMWFRSYGVARHEGVEVELHVVPVLLDLKNVTELNYIPGAEATIRLGDAEKRELHGYEIAAIERRLKRMAIAARDALARGDTL